MVFWMTEFLLWAAKKSCAASPHLWVFIHKPKGRKEKGEGNANSIIKGGLHVSHCIYKILSYHFHTNPMTCYYSHFIDEKLKLREFNTLTKGPRTVMKGAHVWNLMLVTTSKMLQPFFRMASYLKYWNFIFLGMFILPFWINKPQIFNENILPLFPSYFKYSSELREIHKLINISPWSETFSFQFLSIGKSMIFSCSINVCF